MTDLAERMVGRAGRAVAVMMDEESTELAVHPAAAVFPMLSDDELRELAEDIKQNGQIHPIMLDGSGAIVDGRNRRAACTLAGVEPWYAQLPDGADPLRYVLSANAKRRHMTKGALAMAMVESVIETITGLGRTVREDLADLIGTSTARIAVAAYVHRHAHPTCLEVIAGALGLDAAKAQAKARDDEESVRADATARAASDMARLEAADSKLADLVREETVSLAEAIGVLEKREREAREQRQRKTRQFMDGTTLLWGSLFGTPEHIVETWLPDPADGHANGSAPHLRTADGLRELAALIVEAAAAIERHGGRLP